MGRVSKGAEVAVKGCLMGCFVAQRAVWEGCDTAGEASKDALHSECAVERMI